MKLVTYSRPAERAVRVGLLSGGTVKIPRIVAELSAGPRGVARGAGVTLT